MSEHKPRVEHRSGGSNLWATPRDFIHNLVGTLNLRPFALDLAAEASTTVAPYWYGPGGVRADALSPEPWATHDGSRFLNPEYSRACGQCPDRVWHPACAEGGHRSVTIRDWMARASHEGTHPAAGVSPIVALVPASTGTAWWHGALATVDEVYFVQGRMRFMAPDEAGVLRPAATGAAFDSAVLVWRGVRSRVRNWAHSGPRFGSLTTSGLLPATPWHKHVNGAAA